ncbi:MAG: hypothetical protein JXA58_08275, partial [Dehalococcoidia bacterium]|nr:hypothetical protein [Dehalococcoidia bacterium]
MNHSPETGSLPTSCPPSGFRTEVRLGFNRGLRRGIRGFLWIAKILVPVSFAVALLDWTGWLYALDPLFRPIMALINLPPQAALPIITALFSSFYAALAMMVTIPFSHAQMILMAIFMSIAHMIVVEGLIQHKAGINGVLITVLRLVAAGTAVYIASQFLPGTESPVVMPAPAGDRLPLSSIVTVWTLSTLRLLLKIVGIIVPVMIV